MQTSPETICGFKVISELGRGAMGVVYLAVHESLGRQLAIKVMAREYTEDKEFVARFKRESQIAARLRHPNIVQIYDFAVHDGIPYIAMEYLGSETMKSLIQNDVRVSVQKSVHLADDLLAALEHAHAQGIVHRDIKPANVMVTDAGDAALTDFSISYMVSASQLTQTGTIMGTPEYMAPEQLDGRYDARSDIYAVGVCLYEMLTGISPFRADTMSAVVKKQLFNIPDSPTAVDFTVPEALSEIVLKSLEKEPEKRYQSATEMRQAIRIYLAVHAPMVNPPAPMAPPVPSPKTEVASAPAAPVFKAAAPPPRPPSALPSAPNWSATQDVGSVTVVGRQWALKAMDESSEPDTVIAPSTGATGERQADTVMENSAATGQMVAKSNGSTGVVARPATSSALSLSGDGGRSQAPSQRPIKSELQDASAHPSVEPRSGFRFSGPFWGLVAVIGGLAALAVAFLPRTPPAPVAATPGQGQLVFSVNPQAVQLTVDGTPYPKPINSGTIVALTEGKHKLGFQAQRHKPLDQAIYVSPGPAKPVEIKLDWTVGNLTVSALPKGSKLLVDGKSFPSGQPVLDLAPGDHKVEVSKDGYISQKAKYSVVAGTTVKQSITLKAKPKPPEPKPVVTAPAEPVPYYPPNPPPYYPPPPAPGPGPGTGIWQQ